MALVAYSDESDISDSEENQEINTKKINEAVAENKDTQNGNFPSNPKAIDAIEPDDDDEDIMNDVPTVQTWNITKYKEPSSSIDQVFKKDPKSKKLKLVLPALSEFDDDEDEDKVDEDLKRKRIQPSSRGTGLFAVLPKPKSVSSTTSLVPLHVSRKSASKPNIIASKTNNIKNVKPQNLPSSRNDSDDEWDSKTTDFFSLEKSDSPPPLEPKLEVDININPKIDISQEPPVPSVSEKINYKVEETVNKPSISFVNDNDSSEDSLIHPASKPDIDSQALRRLAGRRNLAEIPDIIDINADDALMSREEWVTRALCDEKPKTSFSKKREGVPTHQQRRKHQITYLAHQAQEREKDLQNTWGQNRFTKLQTQSRYGF